MYHENKFINDLLFLIKKVVGKGEHQLHEPLFRGNEIKYLKKTILTNYVSSVGKFVENLKIELRNEQNRNKVILK